MYVYLRYIKGPLLTFEDGFIYYSALFSKAIAIQNGIRFTLDNKKIVFQTNDELLSIKSILIDKDDKLQILKYLKEGNLEK